MLDAEDVGVGAGVLLVEAVDAADVVSAVAAPPSLLPALDSEAEVDDAVDDDAPPLL